MIRKATETDIDQILLLAKEFWAHTLFDEEFDSDHTRLMVEMALDHGLLAVLEIKKIVGFIAGIKSHLVGSKEALIGTELAWWVNPEHRKGRQGIDLMIFMEKLAKEQGIKYWNMASMESSNPRLADRIYKRLGYEKSETIYTKVI